MNEAPVLIVGANGKTGSRVDQRMRARGIAMRAVSQSSATPFGYAAIAKPVCRRTVFIGAGYQTGRYRI